MIVLVFVWMMDPQVTAPLASLWQEAINAAAYLDDRALIQPHAEMKEFRRKA
jgi:hypothetical protein